MTESIDYANPPEGVFVYHSYAHFDELDALWVMHHSRFLKHLERAQQALFDEMMAVETFDPQRYPDLYIVVKRVEIDYRQPLRNVRPFIVVLRGQRLREAGLQVLFEFRSVDGTELYAQGTRSVCKLGLQTHQPTGWSASFRQKYEAWVQAGKKFL